MSGALMAERETLGEKVQRLRLAAGLTQEQLADRAGLSVHNVRNWEHDHRQPRLEAVLKLARALGVPMEELAAPLDDEPPPPGKKGRRKKGD